MVKKNDIPKDMNIIKIPLEEAMPDNYLPYAVEVAKDRALPDVRDGLKPVHRRILYGSYVLKAFPDKPYFKSARIVGDILGKYHPHGDTSVYDAMVILAQDFTTRKTLIDGHGNWGSQDGDNAAAMRYTEARLTPIAMEMIKDIDKDVVNMVDNYSNSEKEPEVLPAKYPNLLVNGAFGIAVGLATNIPPHNLNEVIDGLLAFIDNNSIDTAELMKYVKGPDLPTGGVLIGKNSLKQAYETGEGKVTLRAKACIEKLESGKTGIVITEFPFRRSKAKLLQIISDMTADKKHLKVLEPISDIRDESDRNGVRAVIELRKSADDDTADRILKYLYKKTDLQCNLSFNMVALANGKPETMGLKTILNYYLQHHKEVVTRRTKRDLETAEKRFHIVEGFIKAIGIMDEVIKVIRASKSKKDASDNLIAKFGFSAQQAEAILELMLYRLTGLEIVTFEKEYKELEKLIKSLKKILESEKELLRVIRAELIEVKDKFGDKRRTLIVEDDEEAKIDLEDVIPDEDVIITVSNEGFIKRIPLKTYNRSNTDVNEIEHREGDFNRFLFNSNTKNTLMFFTDKGNMYQTKGAGIPEYKWKDKGEKIGLIIKGMDLSQEKVVGAFSIDSITAQKDFLFFTSKGAMKKTGLDKFDSNYSKLMALKLKDNESLTGVMLLDNERQEGFLKITTELGVSFIIEEPVLESMDRSISNVQLINVSNMDKVSTVETADEFVYREFYVNIDKNGEVNTSDIKTPKAKFSVAANSFSRILLFQEDGQVYFVPGVYMQNLDNINITVNEIFDGIDFNKVIKMYSLDKFTEDSFVYFVTKKGMLKKMCLTELESPLSNITAYKFKSSNDSIVDVAISGNLDDILLVTRKGMSILFNLEGVNPMGKIASGVTAITLGEDDEVFWSMIFNPEQFKGGSLKLKSQKGIEKEIQFSDLKYQNRAGKGRNVFLIVFEDIIKEVKYKK
ncbi:MAG: DNA topoisomerase IV subunit A [Solirubrobacterales bacterium]